MALFPEPPEDLLRDATAMPERGQLAVDREASPILVGCRRDGAVSIYWGDDPVLHFDATGRLRRMFFSGQQIVSQAGQLARYVRHPATDATRRGGRITADFEPLTSHLQQQFLATVEPRLQRLLRAVADGSAYWTETKGTGDLLAQRLALLAVATEGGIRIAPGL